MITSPMIKAQNYEFEAKLLPLFTGTMNIILCPDVTNEG
jgi:hypothetical protein